MVFVKKSKVNVNMEFVDCIVRAYFTYIDCNTSDLQGEDISEVLRCAMCKQLSLPTKGYSRIVDDLASNFSDDVLQVLFESKNVVNLSLEQKQGLLEACVHCMEMSRKLAGV